MSLLRFKRLLSCVGIGACLWMALPSIGSAQVFGRPCGVCEPRHCPPHYHVTVPHGPRLWWHHGCPKPVCNPCDLPHWGFYETCWSPWPYPPEWTHCTVVPPAALVTLNPTFNPNAPMMPPMVLPRPGTPAPSPGGTLFPQPANPDALPVLPQPRAFPE